MPAIPFFSQIFLSGSQRRLFEKGVPIFTYHSIAKPPAVARDPFLYIAPPRFDQQLRALRDAGCVSGSLSDVAAVPENRKVVLTFDDGCRNVFENALDILARHKFRAIQFIVADLIGKQNEWDVVHGDAVEPLMDAAEIREWLAAGHEIGSHTLTHRNLKRLSSADAREQIFSSKKKLEDSFGIEIRHFCYPHGKWNPLVRDLVAEAGYATACTTRFGVNTPQTPRFELRRIFPLSRSEMIAKIAHRLIRKFRCK